MATLFLLAAVATFGMDGVRLAPWLSLTDLFLTLATLLLLPRLVSLSGDDLRQIRPLYVGLLLIGLGGLIGTAFAGDPGASLARLTGFLSVVFWILLVVAAWQPRIDEILQVAWVWAGSVWLSGLWALIVGEYDINHRAMGLTTHPNQLAIISVLASGPAIALAASVRSHWRWPLMAGGAIFPLAILSSGSRAGVLGYAAVILLFACVARNRSLVLAALAGPLLAAMLVLAGLVPLPTPNALQRLLGSDNPRVEQSLEWSNAERRELLSETLARIERHPLTGEGFTFVYEAHNIVLQLWSAAGVLGLLGLVLIVRHLLRVPARLVRQRRMLMDTDPGPLVLVGLCAGFTGYLVVALFQSQIADHHIWLTATLISLLAPAVAQTLSSRPSPEINGQRFGQRRVPHAGQLD